MGAVVPRHLPLPPPRFETVDEDQALAFVAPYRTRQPAIKNLSGPAREAFVPGRECTVPWFLDRCFQWLRSPQLDPTTWRISTMTPFLPWA